MRGHILSYGAYKQKEKRAALIDLEKEIRSLEIEHSLTNNDRCLAQLKQKRVLYNNLCTQKVESTMARTKYHYYEFGNKTSRLLAWQIKKEESERYIH